MTPDPTRRSPPTRTAPPPNARRIVPTYLWSTPACDPAQGVARGEGPLPRAVGHRKRRWWITPPTTNPAAISSHTTTIEKSVHRAMLLARKALLLSSGWLRESHTETRCGVT